MVFSLSCTAGRTHGIAAGVLFGFWVLRVFGSRRSSGKQTAREREFVSGLSDAAPAAMNVPAVGDGPGACEITRSGRGTTCRGPSTA
jgi:hypothetical protein